MSERVIVVDLISRIEGEASLKIVINAQGKLEKVTINVFEAPRFFEGFLIGRMPQEVPEITSRVCGICYVAHQIAALRAIEKALGLEVSEQTEVLRALLSYGGMIQSHALHLFFLALPDFFNCGSIFELVEKDPRLVKWGFRLKEVGDRLTQLIGGRISHPVTPTVGGFTKLPSSEDLRRMVEELKEARRIIDMTVDFLSDIELPSFSRDYEFVALTSNDGYPVNSGILISNLGLRFPEDEYCNYIEEKEVPYSTCKRTYINGRGTFAVGPLARVNMNFDKLTPSAKEAAEILGFKPPCYNLFSSHLARAIEILHFIDEAITVLENFKLRDEKPLEYEVRPGEGCAVVEAPRGILFHQYRIGRNKRIERANIITPTVHNVGSAEDDLLKYIPSIADLPEDAIKYKCERLIRCYDFCLSCSVHVERAAPTRMP